MNARYCEYFCAIEESGSISQAAKKLGISQAALSKFLSEQESRMHAVLFVRRSRRMYPTPAGRAVLDASRRILETRRITLRAIARLGAPPAGTLRVACTPYRGTELFSRVYTRFAAEFPRVDLCLEDTYSATQEEKVHDGTVDFALGANCHAAFDDVCNLAVSREEIVLAVPPFHPLAAYAGRDAGSMVSMPIRAFWDTPFVLPSRRNNIRLVADRLFREEGFSPIIAFESDSSIAVEYMLRRGAGAGFVSRRYAAEMTEMTYFRLDPPCYEVTYLRWRAGRALSDADRFLCGLLLDERSRSQEHSLIQGAQVQEFLRAVSERGRGA